MLIWSRMGFLVPVVAVFTLALTEYVVGMTFNNSNYYEEYGWPTFVALVVAGLLCKVLGDLLNKSQGKKYIDEETGEVVVIKKTHTFFYISVQYWGIILPIIGLILWITN